MNTYGRHSVLILEDDNTFRSLVSGLLQSRGVDVIEASSVREATIKLGASNPLLAIVDYRLPESDGITWITKLREEGKNFPIVFLSGIWCDEKTFDWLRNILRVSLILQKPLVPDLFLRQIESLLPKGTFTDELDQTTNVSPTNTSSNISRRQDSSQNAKAMDYKSDIKERMAALREDYAGELFQSWADLTKAVSLVREDPANAIEKDQAIHLAHKIRGTAGSVGFTQVGEIAGKLEDLLRGLDPDDPLREVVWSEIVRALPTGEELVRAIIEKTSQTDPSSEQQEAPLYKLLLVGNREMYAPYLKALSKEFSVEIDITDSVLGCRTKLANQKSPYHAALLDFDCIGSKQGLFDLTKDIRLAQEQQTIPIGIVLSLQNSLTPADLAYAGMSAAIKKEALDAEIETAVATMFSTIEHEKPRILIVDDDEILAKFLANLLKKAGMVVQILHKPIKVVSAAESFNPDLVLLDVLMPGLSGYDVCRILRVTGKWKQVPVLFLTSEGDQTSRAAAFKAGGSDFLCKPVIAEEVLTRVKIHLQNKLASRQLQKDELTGALSSNAFFNMAGDLLLRAEKQNQPFALCMISIEHFVKLSAQHGWYPMQTVLSTLGNLLKGRFKSNDLRGRLSDDTFALAFYGEDRDTIDKMMADLRNEFANIKFPSDSVGHFKTIFSMGIAMYPSDGSTVRSLLDVSHKLLTDSKLSAMI